MATKEELVKLADELDGWHDCADGDVHAGNGHFRLVCVHDSEQQRLNLRATLREASTALRRLASSDSGVKGEPEPVAWRWRYEDQKKWTYATKRLPWMSDRDVEIEPLYTASPADAGMREAYSALCLPRESQASDNLEGALIDIERLSAQGKPTDDVCIRTLKRVLEQIVRAEQALTAPGATTKSPTPVQGADSARDDVPLGYERVTDGTTLPGDKFRYSLDNNGVTGKVIGHFRPIKPGPSNPSSTRSENQVMTDDQIKHMVDRFLMWKLPEHFSPDCGISFDQSYRSEHGPVGTNLLDAVQATAMVRHMLEGLPPNVAISKGTSNG